MTRWRGEVMGLEFEAERLVRSGESRAEVSRRLGVHPQTLAGWALRGRWRKKDLELERAEDIRRQVILNIREGNRIVDEQNAMRLRLAETMQEAVRLLALGDAASLAKLERLVGAVEPAKLLAGPDVLKQLPAPKVALGPDPVMEGYGSVGDWDADNAPGEVLTEDDEAWSPEVQKRHDAAHRARVVRRGKRSRERARGRNED